MEAWHMGSLFNFGSCREVDWRRWATKAENGKGKGKKKKRKTTTTTDPSKGRIGFNLLLLASGSSWEWSESKAQSALFEFPSFSPHLQWTSLALAPHLAQGSGSARMVCQGQWGWAGFLTQHNSSTWLAVVGSIPVGSLASNLGRGEKYRRVCG